MLKLLAVVEVDKDSRVFCQSPECNKAVYKRIHVVDEDGRILVLGSHCYSKLYEGSIVDGEPTYFFGTNGRKLTEEERNLLLENTRLLIEKFENEVIEEKILINNNQRNELKEVVVKAPCFRDVNCTYCGSPMATRAKSMPAVGYMCDICFENNRPAPSHRMGITKEMNARANMLLSTKLLDATDAYRKLTGK
jgi:hypothetical protein